MKVSDNFSNQGENKKEKLFYFDDIFGDNFSNNDIFHLSISKLIEKFCQGFNSTIFAYGITGSGKTYTIFGNGYYLKNFKNNEFFFFKKIKKE